MLSSRIRSLIATAVLLACAGVVPASAKQVVRQIPFADWLSAQGVDLVGWQEKSGPRVDPPVFGNIGVVDYAGGRAAAQGLSFGFAGSGSVTVRQRADGTGEVLVNADFSNAITWTRDASNVPLFAYTPPQLAADATLSPGLSSGHLQAKYIVPDANFPELNLLVVASGGAVLENLSFRSDGLGPLRAGFGVAEGTPGQCTIVQTGLFSTRGRGATADGFPVEHVDVKLAGAALTAADPSLTKSTTSLSRQGSSASHSWGQIKARFRDLKADE